MTDTPKGPGTSNAPFHGVGAGLSGLANINVELTSRCNKNCWMCGRRRIEREYPELALRYGDMEFELAERIAGQLPPGVVVQLHNNGEPLLYPRLGEAIALFRDQITQFDTNGKLLLDKAHEIIGVLDTMAISVIENDPESEAQLAIIEEFLSLKGDRKPYTLLRLNGAIDERKYDRLGLVYARRALHSPMGSYQYQRAAPTVPEVGICLDFLHHLAISADGSVSICVRFDPLRLGVLGNVRDRALAELWNGPKRAEWLECHKRGLRSQVPLCSYCHFWGVPTSSAGRELPGQDKGAASVP
ncbi:MAG: hypothetical protein A3K19_13030 [Lentisphaerae bacterium RIFOXYB12_FULL_65_16]|nr:MAG: hypothetical protein A3K18_04675 [Lentisphaerae bacterium RIFOXYA12_64_32]OGV87234.1 MAG: hypothetical protein A3K19_13030 [Lentisphaerae bacterium RIFOXYB12_FULL_65_16]